MTHEEKVDNLLVQLFNYFTYIPHKEKWIFCFLDHRNKLESVCYYPKTNNTFSKARFIMHCIKEIEFLCDISDIKADIKAMYKLNPLIYQNAFIKPESFIRKTYTEEKIDENYIFENMA